MLWEDGAPLEIVEQGIGLLESITVAVVLALDFEGRVDELDGVGLMEERTPVAEDETQWLKTRQLSSIVSAFQ